MAATDTMTTAPIRILVADDQRDIRIGFRMILDAQPDMRTVGEAADGADAIDCARRLRPDVVLADIRMPGPDGLEVTRVLAGPDAAHPTKVIVVTTFDLDEYVYTALANGACGFLLKRSGPALLTEAVRAAVAGDVLISPSVTVRLLRHLSPLQRPPPEPDGTTDGTTDRQGGRGRPARGPGTDQRGDRHRTLHHGRHRQNPCGQHPAQTRRTQSRRHRRLDLAEQPDRSDRPGPPATLRMNHLAPLRPGLRAPRPPRPGTVPSSSASPPRRRSPWGRPSTGSASSSWPAGRRPLWSVRGTGCRRWPSRGGAARG